MTTAARRARHFRIFNSFNKETAMDKKLMDAGLVARRAVLGDEYVDRAMKNVDDQLISEMK